MKTIKELEAEIEKITLTPNVPDIKISTTTFLLESREAQLKALEYVLELIDEKLKLYFEMRKQYYYESKHQLDITQNIDEIEICISEFQELKARIKG